MIASDDPGMAAGSFASADLTPAQVRDATFSTVTDGGWHPGEVREFLDQVATALEVITSADLVDAIRSELRRSADISARIVQAGQETAERMKAEAHADAQELVKAAQAEAVTYRSQAQSDAASARTGMEEMRDRFLNELRDIYDRIGASLYRFERAVPAASSEGSEIGAAHEAAADALSREASVLENIVGGEPYSQRATGPAGEWAGQTIDPAYALPASNPAGGSDPLSPPGTVTFDDVLDQVEADEPLAEGEPLVDLVPISAEIAAAQHALDEPEISLIDDPLGSVLAEADSANDHTGGFSLDDGVLEDIGAGHIGDVDGGDQGDELEDDPLGVISEDPAQKPESGGWLMDADPEPAAFDEPAELNEPALYEDPAAYYGTSVPGEVSAPDELDWDPADDERAEAVLEDMDRVLGAIEQGELPDPPTLREHPEREAYAHLVPDTVNLAEVREIVLQSIGDGMPRDVVAKQLREQLGVDQADELIELMLRG